MLVNVFMDVNANLKIYTKKLKSIIKKNYNGYYLIVWFKLLFIFNINVSLFIDFVVIYAINHRIIIGFV